MTQCVFMYGPATESRWVLFTIMNERSIQYCKLKLHNEHFLFHCNPELNNDRIIPISKKEL